MHCCGWLVIGYAYRFEGGIRNMMLTVLEHPPTSQVEDSREYARMDEYVCQQPGFRDYGASLHEAQDAK